MLFETGLTFLNSLLEYKIINDLYIFRGDIKLGKNGENNGDIKMIKKITPKLLKINLNNDRVFKKEF